MDGPSERSAEELLAEAEEAATGRLAVGQFVASLDWSLPRISQRGGDYAAQCVAMIADALDDLGVGGGDLSPAGARALAAAAAVAARQGHDPAAVAKVHAVLVSGGILPAGPAPEPRPKTIVYGGDRVARPADDGARDPDTTDPALDPEIAAMARRVAPRRGAYQSLGLLGLGWAIAICLVAGIVGGIWLDGRLGTAPLLLIVGTALGLICSYLVFREMLRQSRA